MLPNKKPRKRQMIAHTMVPHVLVFPFPAQGHINTMLRLAELLSLSGLHVTFLNTHHNHDRLLRFGGDVHARLSSRPGFRFLSISDGLAADDQHSAAHITDLHRSMSKTAKSQLRELLISGQQQELNNSPPPPVTCVIADGIFSFAVEVGGEVGIPVIAFRTISACAFWAYFCIPNLIKGNQLPFPDEVDMDGVMECVPGMEGFLRRRDLPLCFRSRDLNDPMLQLVLTETQATTRASALLVNTFESLESSVLSHIRSHIPNTYAVGPLHSLVQTLQVSETTPSTSISLWKEDRTCVTWLDSQPHKSVLYVSYGSFTVMSRDELLEFWHGLVDSNQRFLWVLRSNLIGGKDWAVEMPPEVEVGTRERGCLVRWAPQEEVLKHPAVGGFLTHSGWNSTLESVMAGVPMLCWPFFADQQINSRYVSDVWRVGLDMKDTCNRITVKKMVRELMERGRAVELRRSAGKLAEMARRSVGEGGVSLENLNRMINDIKFKQLRVPIFETHNAT